MCKKVINRKNIVLSNQLSTDKVWTTNISMSFQPDTMIVKLVTCSGMADPTSKKDLIRLVKCDNINEYICSFYDGSVSSPGLVFDVRNTTVNTDWTFRSHDYDGTLDSTSDATIAIHLEFLQHEK